MKELRCPNCGGYVNPKTYVCEYCGTRFEKLFDSVPAIKYVVESPKVRTLACAMQINNDDIRHFGGEKISEYCVREMSLSLAKQLEQFITIDVEDNPYNRCKTVRGRVRLVDPSFKFI